MTSIPSFLPIPSVILSQLLFLKTCIIIQAQMGEVVTLSMKAKNVLILLTCMLQSISLMNKFKSLEWIFKSRELFGYM